MKSFNLALCAALLCLGTIAGEAQVLKRTTTKTDSIPLGAGSTLSIVGAPVGDIQISATSANTAEIIATVEVQATNEADLAGAAALTGYVTQESLGRVSIVSIGPDTRRKFTSEEKKLIKRLAGLPYKIDYTIKVPKYTSVQIDAGKGLIDLDGVDGQHKVSGIDSKLRVSASGLVSISLAKGSVEIEMLGGRRFSGIDASVVSGDISVVRFRGVSADVDAAVLRTGRILVKDTDLKPRDPRAPFTEKVVRAKAGAGGAGIKLTVGDGSISLLPLVE